MPRVGVPWNSDGFAETNGESGGRRRDRGNFVDGALRMIHSAESRGRLQPQGKGEDERNRSLETQAAIANPENAHGLKVTGSFRQKDHQTRWSFSILTKES